MFDTLKKKTRKQIAISSLLLAVGGIFALVWTVIDDDSPLDDVNKADNEAENLEVTEESADLSHFYSANEEEEADVDFDEEDTFDQWILKWEEDYTRPEEDGVEILSIDYERNLMLIQFEEGIDQEEWFAEWGEREDIEYLEPNREMKLNSFVSEAPPDSSTDYLQHINAQVPPDLVLEEDEVTVAIVDTGVDTTHPALEDYLLEGTSVIEDDGLNHHVTEEDLHVQDQAGHGTQVSGVLVSVWEHMLGEQELEASLNILPIKAMYQRLDEQTQEEGPDGDVYYTKEGILKAVENEADVILLSIGHYHYSHTIADAVEEAEEEGILVVAAVGNDDGRNILYPAAYPTVMGVGAVEENGERANYANYGDEVSVAAPGRVFTTDLMENGKFINISGTSFAAPQVASLSALLTLQYPELAPDQMRNHIIYSAEKLDEEGWNEEIGFGKIDVENTLTTALETDVFNPNGGMEEAAPFPVQSLLRSELKGADDEDWYFIDPPYEGQVALEVELQMAKQKGVELTYYPEGDAAQAERFTIEKSKEIVVDIEERSVIRIRYHEDEKRTTPLPYHILNTFIIYEDAQQPNDSPAQATELYGDGQQLIGTKHHADDEDWFVFEATTAGMIHMRVWNDSLRLDPEVMMYNEDLEQMGRFDLGPLGNDGEEFSENVEEGTYYFKVDDYYAGYINAEYYLDMVFEPHDEEAWDPPLSE